SFACFVTTTQAQSGTWTWIKGDSINDAVGSYGTIRVAAAGNEPPARYACLAQWTDTAGFFWMYGGYRFNCSMADMWRFDPNTQMWTWMSGDSMFASNSFSPVTSGTGIYNTGNKPGTMSVGMFAWVTPNNHLWLFGQSSDLWQYDPAVNQWAFMGNFGSTNYGTQGIGNSTTMPGGRSENTCAWVDSTGNLWLFGGYEASGGDYNDLWKYDVSTGIWTWMSGSQTSNDPGIYGTIGVPSVNNYPGSRVNCVFWKDDGGNFWLSGGLRTSSGFIWYQDVWKFNPLTLEWTWESGASGNDTNEVSVVNCDTSYLNKEGPRWENRGVWKMCDDLVINYGGYQANGIKGSNDLWAYKVSAGEWIKIGDWPDTSRYGIKGSTNALNHPGDRFGSIGFLDRNKGIWLFGGINYLYPSHGTFNDLWKYTPDSTCIAMLACSSRSCQVAPVTITCNSPEICASDSAQICAPSGYQTYNWNNSASSQCIYAKLSGNYYVTVTDNTGCTAESNHISLLVFPQPQVSVSVSGDTMRVFNSVSQQWYLNGNPLAGDTGKILIALVQGDYTVQVADSNGCSTISNKIPFVLGIDELQNEKVDVYPNPLSKGNWNIDVSDGLIGSRLEVYDESGRIIYKSEIHLMHSEIELNAARGIYLLRISSAKGAAIKKLVKL
ncbi:MAG: Kelch repeat type 2-containing protein, partial [Bacteroidota bacterium]|nr:Kelch repeat type 2-containing protein [Bacteroidota bacterium]